MGTTKPFGGLHVLAIGDFFQMAPVMDSYIFKDDYIGPLAINLWTTHFYISSFIEIMQQQGEKQFCEILNRLQIGELTENDQAILNAQKIKKR